MNMYSGQICPCCNNVIQENDIVVVCPECGVPHHRSCWEASGCTTFGCSQQRFDAAPAQAQPVAPAPAAAPAVQAVCTTCGYPLSEDQGFCPHCGTARTVPQAKHCVACGNALQDGQMFCSKCGARVEAPAAAPVNAYQPPVAPAPNPAISHFNETVVQTKKKKKKGPLFIAIAIILVLAIAIGSAVSASNKEQRAAAAKASYLADASEFLSFSLTAGSNVEDIVDTIQTYWYDSIWKDKYGGDINNAIAYAMRDKSSAIDKAETHFYTMQSLYNRLRYVPDDIADEDRYYIERIANAVCDLYDVYYEFYQMAVDPSGSYNSYSAANKDVTNKFLDYYDALDNLIN
jgi:predicted nucleic acid-binding Zn ribbon protein